MRLSSTLIVLLAVFGQYATPIVAQQQNGDTPDATDTPAYTPAERETRQKLKAIVYAIHVYADKHNRELPPAIIPNADLPVDKRLSGFVLLLPYFAEKPSYLEEAYWDNVRIPQKEAELAAELFKSMDLKKAWDDPANLKAAKTAINVLQLPGTKTKKTKEGNFVSHLAFVRGFGRKEDGAFPNKGKIKIFDAKGEGDWIADGTVNTLAIGQIFEQTGAWTAAGDPTSRHLFHPSAEAKTNFGSKEGQAAYFANCDGSLLLVDIARSTPIGLRALTTRSGDDKAEAVGNARTYSDLAAWKAARRVAGESSASSR